MAAEESRALIPGESHGAPDESPDYSLPASGRDWRLYNVVILGVAFMFLFTAFQTGSMVETLVLDGARDEPNATFDGKGYTSLAIIYSSMAVCNWIAPSVVAFFGAKWSMLIGAILYCLFIATFVKPLSETLYAASALVGLGAAVLWTAQGNCLTVNSELNTMGRNTAIFWALFQSSVLIGNIYVYFKFQKILEIEASIRQPMFIVLTILAVLGTLLFIAIRKPPTKRVTEESIQSNAHGPLQAFKTSIRLLFTKEMLLLSTSFAYTGLEQSFWAAVYGTSVGRTGSFGDSAKQLTGLCGVFIGLAEIIGGVVLGVLGNRSGVKMPGRDTVMLLGFSIHITAFYLVFLNLPAASPIEQTDALPFLVPNKHIAIFCAFLLGLGDCCFNTQVYAIVGALYQSNSAPAFALFKFIQSLASAATFVYSQYIELHWQLLILVIFATSSVMSFFVVDGWAKQQAANTYTVVNAETDEKFDEPDITSENPTDRLS